jgi:magnesium-transporting ATPase (P-type)
LGSKNSNNVLDYDIVAVNEFTSERKIMSVLVREKATGKYFSYVKGAESAIMARLTPESAQSGLKTKIEDEVFKFGGKGLRTLVFAMKEMDQEEVNAIDWSKADG